MNVSVMITTHNRVEDLRRTLSALKSLDPLPDEILITADGCTDDTIPYLQSEYPDITLTINPEGRGSVASRAAMMEQAASDLVLALDDDSYPEQVDFLLTLQNKFDANPRLAIATFPQRSDEYRTACRSAAFAVWRLHLRDYPGRGQQHGRHGDGAQSPGEG